MVGRVFGFVIGAILLLVGVLIGLGLITADGDRDTVITIIMGFATFMLILVGGIFILSALGKLKSTRTPRNNLGGESHSFHDAGNITRLD